MEFLLHNQDGGSPRVSFVLLDWSRCESLHVLDYLARQDIDRNDFEILWIEYFSQRNPELIERVARAEVAGERLPVDTWVVLDMPEEVCLHKHLLYNVGLLASRGELVCFCDAHAMLRPGFVRSILEAFDADPNIVLHHDQVRNESRRFHPFRYPAFDDVSGPGCVNWVNGQTLGLCDTEDPLRTRNYAACMTARRGELVAIGGADMHADYLGDAGGPYEMTFRLANSGLREVWHPSEFLYHTWHPGDAVHSVPKMPTRALEQRTSDEVEPSVLHSAVEQTRQGVPAIGEKEFDVQGWISMEWLTQWRKEAAAVPVNVDARPAAFQQRFGLFDQLRMAPTMLRLLGRQLGIKQRKSALAAPHPTATPASLAEKAIAVPKDMVRKMMSAWRFLPAAMQYNRDLVRRCWRNLALIKSKSVDEFMLAGDGVATDVIRKLAGLMDIRIRGTCKRGKDGLQFFDETEGRERHSWDGVVLIADLIERPDVDAQLHERGVSEERIVRLS